MVHPATAVVLLAAACGAAASARSRGFGPRIVGGAPADIGAFPWQVSVQQVGAHSCGGSVIGARWVLTAAHCLDGNPHPADLSVRAGTSVRESGGVVFDIALEVRHEGYHFPGHDFDIGLLQIAGSFSFGSNIQAVSLATAEPAAGTAVNVSGWGLLSDVGPSPLQLQAATTSVVSRQACNATYGGEVTERMICAAVPGGGRGACGGDSGGPLVTASTQYGVVSWGTGCGEPGFPGVYTSVAALRDWIRDTSGV